MTRRWFTRKIAALASVAALAATLAAGCGPIGAIIDTQQSLTDAGYQSVSVNFNVGNGDEVKVNVTVNATPSQTNADDVARLVWQKFHERFALLTVTVHGTGPSFHRDYSYGDLVSQFGPRNPAYDRTSVTSATQQLGLIVIIVVVVLVAGVVTTVVLVRRRRRGRRPPTWSPGGPPWMQGGPGGGSGPAPWARPGTAVQPPGQPPASYPMWPPPEGPPPDRRPAGQGDSPPPGQAPTWPPIPPPPPGSD